MLALLKKRKAQGTIRPVERDSVHTVGVGAFKLINSTLYTTPSDQVLKKVSDDFGSIYHTGYRDQMQKWPCHPLKTIMEWIKTRVSDKSIIICDMGCGDARLAREMKDRRVISVDFAPPTDIPDYPTGRLDSDEYLQKGGFIKSSISSVPLIPDSSCGVVVYSLSLMGPDWPQFIAEGYRIVTDKGFIIIAEVGSRMQDPDELAKRMRKCGLRVVYSTDLESYFKIWVFSVTKSENISPVTQTPGKNKIIKGADVVKKVKQMKPNTNRKNDPSNIHSMLLKIDSNILAPCVYRKKSKITKRQNEQ